MKKLGRCYQCQRIMPIEYLEQIEFYEDHLHKGDFHHKTLCLSCIKKSIELGEVFEKDLKVKVNKK